MSAQAAGTNTLKSQPFSRFERAFRWCGGATLVVFGAFLLTAVFLPIAWLVALELGLAGVLAIATIVLRHLVNDEIGL